MVRTVLSARLNTWLAGGWQAFRDFKMNRYFHLVTIKQM